MDNQEKNQNVNEEITEEGENSAPEAEREPEAPAPEQPEEIKEEPKPASHAKEPPRHHVIKKRLSAVALGLVLVIGVALGFTVWQNSQLPTVPVETQEEIVEEAQPTKEELRQAKKAERLSKVQEAASTAAQRKAPRNFKWNPKWGSNEVVPGHYYFAGVNREQGVVTIYVAGEGSKNYDVPVRAMLCSGGENTLISQPGTAFHTSHKYRWRALSGNVYGQYAVRISGPYLFHSVPYYTPNEADLEYSEYNKLGTPASMGCIRMAIVDVKWIYDNCALGMPVVIYNDPIPGPLGKPDQITIDEEDVLLRGWDPTDIHPANPYQTGNMWEEVKDGTAIEANTEKIIYGFGLNDPLGRMWG